MPSWCKGATNSHQEQNVRTASDSIRLPSCPIVAAVVEETVEKITATAAMGQWLQKNHSRSKIEVKIPIMTCLVLKVNIASHFNVTHFTWVL